MSCPTPKTSTPRTGSTPNEAGSHIAAETIAAVIQQHEKEAQ